MPYFKEKINLVLLFIFLSTSLSLAQLNIENVNFSSKNWKTLGSAKVVGYGPNTTTSISEGVGIAYLEGLEFENGVIECDLFSPTKRAFLGLAFRISKLNNFECIYFQPHTSGQWDAVQYDPIFNSSATWQLYNGKSYQAVADIPTKQWFHVKIEVIGDTAKVYLNNSQNHTLAVKLKHDAKIGSVGVYSYHPAIFKNLKFIKYHTSSNSEKLRKSNNEDKSYISNWLVSDPYNNYSFTKDIEYLNKKVDKWHSISAEENHLINLNRHFNVTKTTNTVLAKVIIESNKKQNKKLNFGYSDKIRIYLNSKKIFEGENTFKESENYEERGYVVDGHKIIDLPLNRGKNELVLEISEKKFGWGFITRMSDMDGIKIFNMGE